MDLINLAFLVFEVLIFSKIDLNKSCIPFTEAETWKVHFHPVKKRAKISVPELCYSILFTNTKIETEKLFFNLSKKRTNTSVAAFYNFSVSQTFSKAKKRVGDQLHKIGFKKMKKKERSLEETSGNCEYFDFMKIGFLFHCNNFFNKLFQI